jgi:hypothetical protein
MTIRVETLCLASPRQVPQFFFRPPNYAVPFFYSFARKPAAAFYILSFSTQTFGTDLKGFDLPCNFFAPSPTNQCMTQSKTSPIVINRVLYAACVCFAAYYVLFRQSYAEALPMLGIALIFDPFVSSGAWPARPMWQKAWLVLHLLVLAVFFVLMLVLP